MSYTKDRIQYYTDLARLAEKGKITTIFFTDSYGNPETYEKSPSAIFLGGGHVAHMDPMMFAVSMAMATKTVGITCTGTTSYIGECAALQQVSKQPGANNLQLHILWRENSQP